MTELKIKKSDLKLAQKRADQMGAIKNSILHGGGNLTGFISEILVAQYLNAELNSTKDYDLMYEGKTVDVKAKLCSTPPMPHYACSVACTSLHQKTDLYVFTRVLNDFSKLWILGYLSQKEFFNKAAFCKKGQIDKMSHLGWRFKADCYNILINRLKEL